MSEPIDDGGPAFPTLGDEFMQTAEGQWAPKSSYGMQGAPGMTLRDWFAGQALAGMSMNRDGDKEILGLGNVHRIAADCYSIADEMLSERAKAR